MIDFKNSVDQKPVFTPWLYGITTVALRFTTVYYGSPPYLLCPSNVPPTELPYALAP